jgi:hypothetical protein
MDIYTVFDKNCQIATQKCHTSLYRYYRYMRNYIHFSTFCKHSFAFIFMSTNFIGMNNITFILI